MTANLLPPPHDLELPIVKLLSHPTYQSYQSHVATLSLFPRVYLSYTPPTWNAPTPPTPLPGEGAATPSKEKKEWKRRIKMYCKLAVPPSFSPLHQLMSAQWVPPLKRSALNVFSLVRHLLRVPMHPRGRVIGTRSLASHSPSLALNRAVLTLSLVVMRNVFMLRRKEGSKKSVFRRCRYCFLLYESSACFTTAT
jgi:hypothetical protein